MSFKDIIANDLDTFVNNDEFADTHTIEGAEIICVVDSDALVQRSGGTVFGINSSEIKIFVKTGLLEENGIEEMGYGAPLEVDGKIFTVMSWNDNMGMSEITLSVPETN